MTKTISAIALFAATIAFAGAQSTSQSEWPVYGGQPAQDHYSPLARINRTNVKNLQVAWTYDTGEKGVFQPSPIIVGSVLYSYTPSQKVIALDATTGKLLWKFDSGIAGTQPARALAYWSDGTSARILAGVMNYLYALDAKTGQPIPSFGENGRVDLREGLGRDPATVSIALTSPGIVYKDLIIVGGRDPETLPCPPGDIRAYDVRTGALRWSFHTIPHPGEYGYDSWPKDAWKRSGAANNWAGMALDAKRGIVYVPTGSAAFDFYGGDRLGDDLFANTLLALDADTGKRLWHFQAVRHDLWDRDFPSPPALVTVEHQGEKIDAVAQTTKQGWIYLFNRVDGQPVFPVEYKRYPASTVPGEVTAAMQPLPTMPAPYARQALTEDMLTRRTPQAHAWAVKEFRTFRSAGQFVPFSLDKPTIVFPGYDGGAEWGGPAVDPDTGIIYVNANEMAWLGGLEENKSSGASGSGLYQQQCSICHGDDRRGSPPAFPSLVDIGKSLTIDQTRDTIRQGKGRMPSFPAFSDEQLDALIRYLQTGHDDKTELKSESGSSTETEKYNFTGYRKFLDPDGYPAIAPPWGTLSAIDLNTGKYVWKIPFGEYPELAAKGMKNTGSENYGGPVVTAGGLLFIGATNFDKQMHAYDKATGKLLWRATLPFSGNATPATYEVNGRQYVVIAAGGKDPRLPIGGVYVAFALPK
ncbi:PQQ-binding-like beta-propeller repeat protein [Alloacidobacterium sp.]|uniref:outer membrane protein assembly factor BamB family protein n=1 Tax=Alloacidobacterium sp. TaxID=2951999 RepID=UPI002D656BE4|nr:PQQ-binding-like beta-propeller repeat protein [Alloacidobacterium sp.]HYK38104.1 PQQ-binding-like beta-propeller repeat protein [Alloacidobacterium sp.]